MEEYEALDCVSMLEYTDRTTKELTRYQLLVSINSMSKRKWEPKEIMKLPWDKKDLIESRYDEREDKELHEATVDIERMLNANLLKVEDSDVIEEINKNTD